MQAKMAREAFETYYRKTAWRLAEKIRAYNEEIRKETHPVIRTFREDLADLNEGGKMLRGLLIVLGYQIATGEASEAADDLAVAYEMFQTGVLIHDDIIDNADFRRGKRTIQNREGDRIRSRRIRLLSDAETPENLSKSAALCTGDLGLYFANLKIAEAYRTSPGLGDVIAEFDRVILDTIRGELLDVMLPCEMQDPSMDETQAVALLEKSVFDIYHLKTAVYSVIGPLHLGMLLGGASEDAMRRMDAFADGLGIAYQIRDDVLGVFADAAALGKDVGSDISEGKQTILYLYVRKNRPDLYPELMRYYGKRVESREILEKVQAIFRASGALSYAEEMLRKYLDEAREKLAGLDFVGSAEHEILAGFVDYCENRKK